MSAPAAAARVRLSNRSTNRNQTAMDDLSRYLEEHRDRFEEELFEFLRIPSVSTDPARRDDVRRCAEWLAEHLEDAGFDRAEVIPAADHGTHPIVYGERIEDPEAPTLLLYGHYDVQPEDPEEEWETPPFDPTVRDGRIYGRGTVDDKGQVHLNVKAVEARLASSAGLPVNLKFVIEGEEEVGGEHLEAFLPENRERLACDAVLISDTAMFSPETPSITTALRGMVYTEVTVRGPASDLHSGVYGGAVVNPLNALGRIIAGLHDAEGRVTVPGYYDAVRPITDADRENLARLPFDEEAYRKKEVGAPALGGEKGFGTLERVWFRPTLDVNGMIGGFTGEGAKTVLPARASAKISMRLVPDQDPDAVYAAYREHVRELAPEGVTVEVDFIHGGLPWAADPESPIFDAAAAAVEDAFGKKPVFTREGGTIPIVPLFERTLNAPVLLLGFGLPGSNMHAPNEWFGREMYHTGMETVARLYDEIAARGV